MKKAVSFFNYMSVFPILIMLASNLIPKGSDPRGYGPVFVVGMVSFLISGIFALTGIIFLFVARKLQISMIPTAIATIVAFIPLATLLVAIVIGHA